MGHEPAEGRLGDAEVAVRDKLTDEVGDQGRKILHAVGEWRQANLQDLETVEEVTPEVFRTHQPAQVLVGGGDEAGEHPLRSRLDLADELGLSFIVEGGHLLQDEDPLVGLLEGGIQFPAGGGRSDHKSFRRATPHAVALDEPGRVGLAGAGSPTHQNGIIGGTGVGDLLEDRPHAGSGTEKGHGFGSGSGRIRLAAVRFDDPAQDGLELIKVEGFGKEVDHAQFAGGDRILDLAVGGDDDGGRPVFRGKGLQELQAILIRQAYVEDHGLVVRGRVEVPTRLGCGGGQVAVDAGLTDCGGESQGQGVFVFDDENAGKVHG